MSDDLRILADGFREALRHAVWVARHLDEAAEFSTSQLAVLNMVAGEGLRMGSIAKNLGVRVPSATEQVARLEKAGLLERGSDPHDARAVVVRRTAAGDEAAARDNALRSGRMADAMSALTDSERAALAAALPVMDKINKHVTNQEMPA
ncbi:hypothetical protein SCMU_30990 [Sinomonas cyclohexanicum]|uniref:HTH marR-type domain-containing protein n=1 Tax=Sinomonas cyclohexanicum TaxID=322009 RepID=A0ABN6FK59_SINCY|nr:MarR family transcriptional regulator [Corynebacterium cyclohexanicum]BCT77257.1 hypothetical protein SCMU_30990 [Corynebacterium cyclohexanicum]